MSPFAALFCFAMLMIVPVWWEISARRALSPFPDATASAVAARLGLRVVEGDGSLDLAREIQRRTSLASLLNLRRPLDVHHVRLEGQRASRRVEVVHYERIQTTVGLLGQEVTHARDVRATVHASRPLPKFELTSVHANAMLALPIAGSLPGGLTGPCTVRSTDIRELDAIVTELSTLAQVACVHVVCDGTAVSLIEPRGTALLATNIDRLLPIVERLVAILDGTREASLSDRPLSVALPVQPEDPILRFYREVGVLRDGALAWLERITALLPSRPVPEERAVTQLGGLVEVCRTPWSRLVLREHGFEWHGLFSARAVRYDAITHHSLDDGALTLGLANEPALRLGSVPGAERLWRIVSSQNLHVR